MASILALACLSLVRSAVGKRGKGTCRADILDASQLDSKAFKLKYRQQDREAARPLIVRNLTSTWPAHTSWIHGGFAKLFADHKLPLKLQKVPTGLPDNTFRTASVKEFFEAPKGTELHEMLAFDIGDYQTYRVIGNDIKPIPPLLMNVFADPVFTAGRKGTGSTVHNHAETWVAQVVGTKAWMLAPLGARLKGVAGDHPCDVIQRIQSGSGNKLDSEWFVCMVHPGEILYFPDGYYHGTCNLNSTVGVGGRGDSPGCPDSIDLAHRCDVDGLQELMKLGVDMQASCPVSKLTPLHAAVQSECLAAIKLLLRKNNATGRAISRWDLKDSERRYPHDIAGLHGYLHILKIFGRLLRYSHMQRTLTEAAASGHLATVDHLLSKQVYSGSTHTFLDPTEQGHLEMLQLLTSRIPRDQLRNDKVALTAAEFGRVHILEWLTTAGHVDLSAIKVEGNTPAHLAVQHGHVGALEVLLKHRANINVSGPGNRWALHQAAEEGHLEVASLLISVRARVQEPDTDGGNTALHEAAMAGHTTLVKLLIDARADITKRNKKGETSRTILQRTHAEEL